MCYCSYRESDRHCLPDDGIEIEIEIEVQVQVQVQVGIYKICHARTLAHRYRPPEATVGCPPVSSKKYGTVLWRKLPSSW